FHAEHAESASNDSRGGLLSGSSKARLRSAPLHPPPQDSLMVLRGDLSAALRAFCETRQSMACRGALLRALRVKLRHAGASRGRHRGSYTGRARRIPVERLIAPT